MYLAPFFTLIPDGPGVACALGLVLLAWAIATDTTIEPAFYVLCVLTFAVNFANIGPPENPPGDGVAGCVFVFGVAIAVTMLISTCAGRIRARASFETVRAGFRRLFSPPGTRGTIHARWFALGLWLSFLVVAVQFATHSHAGYLRGWLIAFLLLLATRCLSPQWEPAALTRVSLFVSAQPLVYYVTPTDVHLSKLAPLVAMLMSLAVVWALHQRWTEWRLWNDRHPEWVISERVGERRVLRERAASRGYRDSTQGGLVGSLLFSPSLMKEAKVALAFTFVFQVINFFSWVLGCSH